MRKNQRTKEDREEQLRYEAFEQTMSLILDAISYGVYQHLQDNFVFPNDKRERIPPKYTGRNKNKKHQKNEPKMYVMRHRNSKIPLNLPGISCCQHGIYECPKCAEERKKQNEGDKGKGNDLPES